MNKASEYAQLVTQRKECRKCPGFVNQYDTAFDTDHIGNFSLWANDLDADVVIVGQDYANLDIFDRDRGLIEPNEVNETSRPGAYSTATNYYLRQLTRMLGRDIGLPTQPTVNSGVFTTNAVLCLKSGAMNAPIGASCLRNCTTHFLIPILDLIKPKVVISLGKTATQGILRHFGNGDPALKVASKQSFAQVFCQGPYPLPNGATLFPVYHPGQLGQNNRQQLSGNGQSGWELQMEDWKRIGEHLTLTQVN